MRVEWSGVVYVEWSTRSKGAVVIVTTIFYEYQ